MLKSDSTDEKLICLGAYGIKLYGGMMKKLVVGILAHVDAGKTTLSEAMLYTTGKTKKLGRVDTRSSYLDTHELERERGITIFSKQAIMSTDRVRITLLDTPGHVDFSAETERTLPVLDYAILVISASSVVQSHTETIWRLLERYEVPTFVFVTKMDAPDTDEGEIMRELCEKLSGSCVDFSDRRDFEERVSMCDESLLEKFLDGGAPTDEDIARLAYERRIFPCFFGSGLKLYGVGELIDALERYTVNKAYPETFGARVYKIGHDKNGNRLSYMKITGGSLSVRQTIVYGENERDGKSGVSEKITGIRLYSGEKYESAETAYAGDVCAVTGLSATYSGEGLGADTSVGQPCLEPVLTYRLAIPDPLPDGTHPDRRVILSKLRLLEEEEPLLGIVWNEHYSEIQAQIMGPIQTEVLTEIISSRFGIPVTFYDGRILYKETIKSAVEGVGHFEPLRHYAEVHLLLEPLPRGSGLVFDTVCSENTLERSWQRLVLTHLEEKSHIGTLTGSPITDMRITLVTGRAHLKHTQGGDFREATYRAVRHGLMTALDKGYTELLEPYYAFRLEVPGECVGRAISDIIAFHGTYEEHENYGGAVSVLIGSAPVSEIGGYSREVAAYTHGRGKFTCRLDGYYPCHNAETVIADFAYDPESDVENTPDSVFCAHGSGFIVPWRNVRSYMHLGGLRLDYMEESDVAPLTDAEIEARSRKSIDERELEAIMEREFGPIKRRAYSDPKKPVIVNTPSKVKKSLYIVDGYNVIFAWEELSEIAKDDLEHARNTLCDMLANYRAFTGRDMIVVFDAYNVRGSVERKLDYHGLHVVFTKEGELGDIYIEKLVHEIGHDFSVRVITSDGLIQLGALRAGVLRMSAREFRNEVTAVDAEINVFLENLSKNQ